MLPGHGDTNVDSHSGLAVVVYGFATLDAVEAHPFKLAVMSGVDAMMTAHVVVQCLAPTRRTTLSPVVVSGYLLGRLGFDGVVMRDFCV